MATTTTNFGWDIPQSTDLVKDGATAIAALGQDIDTALVDLKGGTTGQILAKASNTDLDYSWITNDVGDITAVTAGTGISGGGTSGAVTVTNSMATAIDAKGDLIGGTGADTFARLAVGANGTVLTADSAEATGLKWAVASSASGLTKIAAADFSAITSIDIDSLFSSTYEHYMMVLSCTTSASASFNLRMRHGGTTITSADYYGGGWSVDRGGSTASFGQSGSTSRQIIPDTGGKSLITIFFSRVGNASEEATWEVTGTWGGQQQSGHMSGLCNVAQTYTGINLSVSTGNATGSYGIYGLAK